MSRRVPAGRAGLARRRRIARRRALARRAAGVATLAALVLGVAAVAGLVTLELDEDDEPARSPAGTVAGPPPAAATPGVAPAGISLDGPDAFALRFRRPPRAGLVFDVESGRALWRRHPLRPHPVASLTKVMTALLVVERTTARERVKVTRRALAYRGSGVGVLPRGRRVPIDAVLHGLLLVSGNDAAIALAQHTGPGLRRFISLMNRRAAQLGLRCTHFASPHGLDPRDRSCAADLAVLARLVMRRQRVVRIVRRRQALVPFPIRGGRLHLFNTNPLLRLRYPGTIGLKTGFTRRAGRSFIGVVRRGGRTLGVVLLHSPDPSAQARRLLGRAFRMPAAP